MICPQCGYDMGTKHKCLRCGYEVKTLVTVSEEDRRRREEETKVIDPSDTILTDEFGYAVDSDEEDFFTDPFGSILGDIFGFDPFADLLGGLFGVDIHPRRPHREPEYMDRLKESDEDEEKVVEVKKVEIVDDDGKPVKKKKRNNKK